MIVSFPPQTNLDGPLFGGRRAHDFERLDVFEHAHLEEATEIRVVIESQTIRENMTDETFMSWNIVHVSPVTLDTKTGVNSLCMRKEANHMIITSQWQ